MQITKEIQLEVITTKRCPVSKPAYIIPYMEFKKLDSDQLIDKLVHRALARPENKIKIAERPK
ncbi:TPA: hypothetical protein L6A07_29460 [Pseudomonas aeruginosa]|nr:hypothetical protein [Pseudomonas aeruginosa]